ncbi:MAG TPA: hypothetical protein VK589_11990 [Chryseolinea sp.]|nr:hypothetical protein [Chryseolinea sp.]
MKALKGLLLFGISIGVTACYDQPELPAKPEIDFEDIYFTEAKAVGERDALVLTLSFSDGNGDLGLSPSDIEPPYHDLNYYLADGGDITPLKKRTVRNDLPQFVEVPPNARGKLVTVRTPEEPLYKDVVPSYVDPHTSCTYYTYTDVYVEETDSHIFDNTYNYKVLSYPNRANVYMLTDTFYYKRNPTYTNIDVEFWVNDGSGFRLFDWEKEFCTISFSQRFPVLSDKQGPLEGSLEYAMATSGMKTVFGNKILKLKVRIRDRDLNDSNAIETPEFTLDKITKGG